MAKKLVAESKQFDKEYYIFAGKLRRFKGKSILWYIGHPTLLLRNIRDMIYVFIGLMQSLAILLYWKPDVVFAKGGFVCLPVGIAAGLRHIPLITHDSDAIPGLTNRLLARYSNIPAVGLPAENFYKYYRKSSIVETGVPIASQFIDMSSKDKKEVKKDLGYNSNDKLVVFVGGSSGAERLNDAISQISHHLLVEDNLHIVWATGKQQYDTIKQKFENSPNMVMSEYFTNLAKLYRAADVVVSRAGATSIAELAMVGAPTILVPNPVLTGGHQLINAKAVQTMNACLVSAESHNATDSKELLDNIKLVLSDAPTANRLSNNIKHLAKPDSAKLLAKTVVDLGNI